MCRKNRILAYQEEQSIVKRQVVKIKKEIPIYLIGFFFIMCILIFTLESKIHPYFNGTLNFLIVGFAFTITTCFMYYYIKQREIRKKKRLSKAIGLKLYKLMKLEHE